MMLRLILVVLLVAGCCALCWRKWVVPGRIPKALVTRRLVPLVVAAIGLSGLVLSWWNPDPLAFAHLNGTEAMAQGASWRSALLLQSVAFLAAGLWLISGPASRRLPRWGLLLLPVPVIGGLLLDRNYGPAGWAAIVVGVILALVVAAFAPVVAADLATVGLTAVGLIGIASAVNPPRVPLPGVFAAVPGGQVTQAFGAASPKLAILAAVEGAVVLALGLWLVPRTIGPHARTLLRLEPDAELAGRVVQLTQTRADAVDTAATELRRVERDLHDGAQARLVALGMSLRAAERLIPTSPQAAMALVAEARETSAKALTELRDLVRGVHPPVLADRGLADAVRALALDTPIRTETDIDLPGRLDPPVESACYFAVAEALANAVKHSGARLVQIRIRHSRDLLRIEVTDDGAGSADPARGTGLQGVERRLGTFDGILAVNSPPGGPTMIIMEVPCALSSPRTSSY
jgi:signal transduction histidine kinase